MQKITGGVISFCAVSTLMAAGVVGMVMSSSAIGIDLDIDATTGLTSADTDLNGAANGTGSEAGLAVWKSGNTGVDTDGTAKVPPSNTTNTIPAAQSSPSQTGTGSWDFGKWVLAIPEAAATCGTSATNISQCTNVGFVNVASGYTDNLL